MLIIWHFWECPRVLRYLFNRVHDFSFQCNAKSCLRIVDRWANPLVTK
jgi:hypothetical protein